MKFLLKLFNKFNLKNLGFGTDGRVTVWAAPRLLSGFSSATFWWSVIELQGTKLVLREHIAKRFVDSISG